MRTHARVVVIGGGVMGVSLLYHLTKRGWTDVVLLEKNELTAGSTWHAAGLCTHFGHNLTIMNMRAYSVRLYRDILPEEVGHPLGFHPTGALRITRSADRMDEFRQVAGLGLFAGFNLQLIGPGELPALHPLAETGDGLIGGIFEPSDGHVDPAQATHAMASVARKGGAEICRKLPVTGLRRTPGAEWQVETPNGVIRAEHVVNAAGTWCREIGAMMGVDLPVVPMLHQYLVTDRIASVAGLARELPIIRDPEESWYLRQERDGLLLGPYETVGKPWSVDGIPPEFGADLLPPDLDSVAPIVGCAMQRVPALADAGIKSVINGPITFTPDANPLIGPAFGLTNAWLLTGSSMGVMEGGGAGDFLAEWITSGEPPADALAVDSRRFGAYANRGFRLAKAVEGYGLQFGIHYPFEERRAARSARVTPLYERLREAGAEFGTANGWERPNWFSPDGEGMEAVDSFRRNTWFQPVAEECRRVSHGVGLADLSVFSKFEVSGPEALAFLDTLGANRPPSRIGGIGLLHVLTPRGGIASEFTVTRLADDRFYLVSAAGAERHDQDLLRTRAGAGELGIANVTEEWGVLAIMGPRARSVLGSLTDADLSTGAFPRFSSRDVSLGGVPVRALRLSYVGELGWELHAPMDRLCELHDLLMSAGSGLGIAHFGAMAMNAMRLEKGYPAWGLDLSTERTPLESGLGALVKSEGRSFVGREAMIERSLCPDVQRLVLLALDGLGPDPFHGHPVSRGGRCIGIVSSGAFGHRTGLALALAYLRHGAQPSDASLEVEILGERRPARVLSRAPYDPGNVRAAR